MKFKPSINQTIRGRSTSTLNNKKYNLTEQALQLKIAARLSKFDNENILPLVLTIKYAESVPDLVVNINTGNKVFLTTFVNSTELFKFKIDVENPNFSPAIICIQESINVLPPSMNYISPNNGGSDPALLAATLANATAISALAGSMAAAPNAIADAIANNAMTVTNYPNTLVGSTLQQLLAIDQTRQKITATNWHTQDIKLWKSSTQLPSTTAYSSDGAFITLEAAKVVGGVLKQGGACAIDNDECKGYLYAIGSGSAGSKGIALTVTTTTP